MKRVAFDLDEEMIKELDLLVERAGLSTRKDLFNEAISFFEYCLDNVQKSGSLPMIRNEDGGSIEIAGAPFTRAKKAYEQGKKSAKKSADKLPIAMKTANR